MPPANEPAWDRVKDVFSDVMEQPLERRRAYLDDVCRDNPRLREEVESLISAHQTGANRITGFSVDQGEDSESRGKFFSFPTPAPQQMVGETIGPYKLLEVIAEGGMGVIYKAEQRHPVRRVVALKLIKLGMDTAQVVARFESERQALALMNHRNVASVYDAGATDKGRPYFVMEYVPGEPITVFCDRHNYTTRQRLELFTQACEAIQHAHQKAIIHRDIKPSNILVTLDAGEPIVKVIDFGVAKATSQRLTERTMFTEAGQLIGTPEYMSPEQAEMNQLDIDTRTDIYSLGVVLYELLTGTLPFDPKTLRGAAYSKIQQIIREVDPPRPSTRLSSLGAAAEDVAKHRQTRLVSLEKELRSELEWIPLKALRKDRAQRYSSAHEMSQDIRNYLRQQPLLAGPESAAYRVRKFARRHRTSVLAGTAVALALAAGFMLALVGFLWASQQRDEARKAWSIAERSRQIAQREREEARDARAAAESAKLQAELNAQRADREAKTATATANSLRGMLELANPDAGKGANYTVRALLEDFAQTIGQQLSDRPEAEADLRTTVGSAFARLGEPEKAILHLTRAVELRKQIYGDQHEKYADSLVELAWGLSEGFQLSKAIDQLNAALKIYDQHQSSPHRKLRALQFLQTCYVRARNVTNIKEVGARAAEVVRSTPGVEYPEYANMLHNLAGAEAAQGDVVQAEKLARESIAMHVRLQGPDHPETGWAYLNLAETVARQNRELEGFKALEESLRIFRRAYPPEHWAIGQALSSLTTMAAWLCADSPPGEGFNTYDNLRELEDIWRPSLETGVSHNRPNERDPRTEAVRGMGFLIGRYMILSHSVPRDQGDGTRQDGRRGGGGPGSIYERRAMSVIQEMQRRFSAEPSLQAVLASQIIPSLRQTGHYAVAESVCRKLLDSNPTEPGDLSALAVLMLPGPGEDGRVALELTDKAVELAPNYVVYKAAQVLARSRASSSASVPRSTPPPPPPKTEEDP